MQWNFLFKVHLITNFDIFEYFHGFELINTSFVLGIDLIIIIIVKEKPINQINISNKLVNNKWKFNNNNNNKTKIKIL